MALPRIAESREGWALFLFTIQFVACLVLGILYEAVYKDAVHPFEVFTGVLYSAAEAVFVALRRYRRGREASLGARRGSGERAMAGLVRAAVDSSE